MIEISVYVIWSLILIEGLVQPLLTNQQNVPPPIHAPCRLKHSVPTRHLNGVVIRSRLMMGDQLPINLFVSLDLIHHKLELFME